MADFVAGILRSVADLFFSRNCVVCNRELLVDERNLCLECYSGLPLTWFWLYKENSLYRLFLGRVYLERCWSLFYYTGSYKYLIHSFKYNSNRRLGRQLSESLGRYISENLSADERIDYIVPVPLHFRKRIRRGFNQSEIIAQGIASAFGPAERPKVIANLLKRRIYTSTQTNKEKLERWKNVEKAFRINSRRGSRLHLEGKHLLVVDDVATTGATLEACASILVEQFGCRVSVATLAYVE